jgi:lipopolysaccharide transport system permease protein
MGGIVVWNYFNACFYKTSNSLAANAGLFGKVYFHRLVVPLSSVISSLIALTIQLSIFAILIATFVLRGADLQPNLWLVATPYLVVLLGGLGLALGLVSSALTTRYRDLGQVITFGMQLLMFATPIIYPLSAAGERYRWILKLNPLTPIVETFRFATLGHGAPDPVGLFVTSIVVVPLVAVAISVYMRVERTFVDTV